jgi:putative Holliday junction resolvase
MMENTRNIEEIIKDKRLAGVDFGLKRVGVAVCDEFHITISPRGILAFDSDDFWKKFISLLQSENAGAVVVGIPTRSDGEETELIRQIKNFIKKIKSKTGLPVISYDESYSSKKAVETMIEIGTPKKQRRRKGSVDQVAAAIILREFLEETEG